jgi:hypothetical protein
VTPQELLTLYDPIGLHRVTATGMSRKLKDVGIEVAVPQDRPDGNPQLRLGPENILQRLYILRNEVKWARASAQSMRDHYEKCRGLTSKKKF